MLAQMVRLICGLDHCAGHEYVYMSSSWTQYVCGGQLLSQQESGAGPCAIWALPLPAYQKPFHSITHIRGLTGNASHLMIFYLEPPNGAV
jgi:hypothetical protein